MDEIIKQKIISQTTIARPKGINFQVTAEEHAEILKTAKECGCNLSEYFRRLHRMAMNSD